MITQNGITNLEKCGFGMMMKVRKKKKFVVFVCSNKRHALALTDDESECFWWKHCAEIEQTRRMTNYELAHWLWEGSQVGEFREMIDGIGYITCNNDYVVSDESITVSEDIKIRVNGGEWKEPLIEE